MKFEVRTIDGHWHDIEAGFCKWTENFVLFYNEVQGDNYAVATFVTRNVLCWIGKEELDLSSDTGQ